MSLVIWLAGNLEIILPVIEYGAGNVARDARFRRENVLARVTLPMSLFIRSVSCQ
jgi:hypothetical protein